MVQDFRIREQFPKAVTLEWKPPEKRGVKKYFISFEGYKQYKNEKGLKQVYRRQKVYRNFPAEQTDAFFDGLNPMTTYNFNLSVEFMDNTKGPRYPLVVETKIDG